MRQRLIDLTRSLWRQSREHVYQISTGITGRAEGLSLSVEAHLLSSKIQYDEENGVLTIKGVPT